MADDVLIMQSFELSTFQQGIQPDAYLLLQHLRGESIEAVLQQQVADEKARREEKKRKLSETRSNVGPAKDSGKRASKRSRTDTNALKQKIASKPGNNSKRQLRCETCGILKNADGYGIHNTIPYAVA